MVRRIRGKERLVRNIERLNAKQTQCKTGIWPTCFRIWDRVSSSFQKNSLGPALPGMSREFRFCI
jgi:hypothetical protein